MTRTPREAHAGRLNLLVGGDAATLEASRPILSCFAENITHVGPVGAGHRLKFLHNFVSLGFIALLAEAAACAERTGVSADVFVDVLERGGGAGTALDRLRPYLTKGDADALRFTLANAQKDLTYYGAMARESGATAAIADAVIDTVAAASAELGGSVFVPELVTFLSQRVGRDDRPVEARRPK